MTMQYNRDSEEVDFNYHEFLFSEADNPIAGYNWVLDIPATNPDSTVDIVDGDVTHRFTGVENVDGVIRAAVRERRA